MGQSVSHFATTEKPCIEARPDEFSDLVYFRVTRTDTGFSILAGEKAFTWEPTIGELPHLLAEFVAPFKTVSILNNFGLPPKVVDLEQGYADFIRLYITYMEGVTHLEPLKDDTTTTINLFQSNDPSIQIQSPLPPRLPYISITKLQTGALHIVSPFCQFHWRASLELLPDFICEHLANIRGPVIIKTNIGLHSKSLEVLQPEFSDYIFNLLKFATGIRELEEIQPPSSAPGPISFGNLLRDTSQV